MSTGLTYVSIIDTDLNNIPNATFSYVFASYEEALEYGDWYIRNMQHIVGGATGVVVQIYTTAPGSSGYYPGWVIPTAFTQFD